MKRHRLALALATGIGLALLSAPALAQVTPEAKATADALFDEGRKLKADGNFVAACPKLEASQKLAPGMGTLYNLADCYEQIGRTASAWTGFRDVASQAAAAGRADREKDARARVATLEPRLMRLTIVVPGGAPANLEVKRDGVGMASAAWGTPIPVDPGKHLVSALAPGKQAWEQTIELREPGATVTVTVPALADQKGPPPVVVPADKPKGPTSEPPHGGPVTPPPPPAKRPWQTPLGIGLTGLGAVGLGLGTAFGFMAKSRFDESAAHCNEQNKCDATGKTIRDEAVAQGNLGTGVFIAGAVVAAGGIVLWITAPSAPKASAGAAPLGVAVGPGSLALHGRF